jgi:hypothetical protein
MSPLADRIRMPADIEQADKLAFDLTARQLGLLAATALVSFGLYRSAAAALPLPVAVALIVPVVATGVLLAFGRRDGLTGDQLALAALRFVRQPRLRLLAPEGLSRSPQGLPPRPRAIALDLPIRSVLRSGIVELAPGGFCRVLAATAASFALRSDEEQQALVDGFAGFLNALAEPAQIVVRSEPVDLRAWAARLEQTLPGHATGELRAAASDHGRFVAALAERDDVRRRQILLVLVDPSRELEVAAPRLERRVGETIELLRTAGVELQPLAGEETARLLAQTLDPPGPAAGCALTGTVHRC